MLILILETILNFILLVTVGGEKNALFELKLALTCEYQCADLFRLVFLPGERNEIITTCLVYILDRSEQNIKFYISLIQEILGHFSLISTH